MTENLQHQPRAEKLLATIRATGTMAALLAFGMLAHAAKGRAWNAGVTMDAATTRTFIETGVTAQAGNAGTTTWVAAQLHGVTIQDTQLSIRSDEFLFIVTDTTEKSHSLYGIAGRAIANHKRGCRIIINDPIMFSPEGSTLYVIDADGKECKLDLIRQTRIAPPKAPLPPITTGPSAEKKP
jgi:hypothetical protein